MDTLHDENDSGTIKPEWGFCQALHPEDRDRYMIAQRARDRQQPYTVDFRLCAADGQYHLYTETATPINNAGKVEWRVSLTPHAPTQLKESEQRYHSLVIAISQIVWIASADGSVDDIPAWRAYTGQSQAEVTGWGWLEAIHPEDRDRTARTWLDAVRSKSLYDTEYRIRAANGSYRYFWVRGVPVIAENGSIREWVGICADIHTRKQTEQQLRASEKRYRDLANAMPLIVWTAQANGDIDYYNQPWFDYTGLTPAQSATAWQTVIHPDDLPTVLQRWDQALRHGTLYEIEYRIRRQDGIYRWYLGRAVPVRNTRGDISWVGTATDIDDRKRFEQALQESEATLLHRAAELTSLTKVLANTNAVLEKRNQELDQFAYVASHDLKAPLRAIANLSQWVEEDINDQLSDENRYQMQLLRGRVHRLEALIDGLLQYSRIGRMATASEIVDVRALLLEVLNLLVPPPEFTIAIASEMPTLNTQKILLFQVFSNLINNAIKHHNQPAGTITISATDQGNAYEFTITDDGPGIAPQYHEKVFGIFQTLEARDKVENTGVGLAIVKKIVESQGGRISIESQEGQGATFRFTWLKQ